ncbi:MAG TPA: hypothetical protein PLE45_00830 [Spirochaetota bacterium]|nr:hypothetical protein [Spirochaetota bacterium]HOL56083.1 hypothetical protein [Spirochaetota bacterium]HPP03503.1 hypothetical protein [Spirochaetota bacterium]
MEKYDFVINKALLEKIKNLAKKRSISISALIRKVFEKIVPIIEKKHLKEKRREKDYPIVCATHRVRVYLSKNLYNQLKVIHSHLNTFSMAVLVREILEEYFLGIETFGEEEFENNIERLKKKLEELKRRKAVILKKKDGGKVMPPDIPRVPHPDQYFLLTFDSKFRLLEIKFL